jgi:phosphoribosylanthranilate isomerase
VSAPAVKICGLTRLEDATAAAAAGADFLGMIASRGFGRSAPVFLGPAMTRATGLPVVAVVVNEPLDQVVSLGGETGAAVLQLHGDETPEMLQALRAQGPWKLWKGLRVRTSGEVEAALREFGPVADGILLDGWHPEHRGGSGVRFPWDVVEPLRGRFPKGVDFIAAGGLTPANVAEAVTRLRPQVVDVSSGVEAAPGVKDPAMVRSFVENAKGEGT